MSTTTRLKKTVPIELDTYGFLVHPNGQTLILEDFVSLGRDPANTMVFDDDYISSRHARIERRPYGFVLKDLRSRNGTFLNGVRVLEAPLKHQDILRLGKTELVFSFKATTTYAEVKLSSKNSQFQRQLSHLPQMAAMEIPVLILGPSGVGKELIARAVHELSPRKAGPFVSVNCSALSESLVESELFGHLRGSFTGAQGDRKGAFEAARGGTLFLDEIGDLPLSLQPKLLRALENQEIRPVGSDHAVATDVRIVAATHQNLLNQAHKGLFRLDLFYRLQGVQIEPPALCDRLEDFEDLLFAFAREYRVRFSFSAIQELKKHPWPGNIRELKNTVGRAKALFDLQTVEAEHVPQLVHAPPPPSAIPPAIPFIGDPGFSLKKLERDIIVSRLQANSGNQRRTAEELGIPKSTLHDRIRNYGIDV